MSAADNDFQNLQERIKTHPGKKIFDALRAYDMSKFILDGNTFQLRQLILTLEDPKDPAQIMGVDGQQRLRWLFNDVNRHIHNFLTSITTLVDHSRHLMDEEFIKTEHREEYQNKVRTVFASDPLTQFLQDFRNYITHYEIPHIGLKKQFGSLADGKSGELYIALDHLALGFHWSSSSKKFIDAHKPEVRMLKLVDDYELKSKSFYNELMLSFQKHLGRELNGVHSLMQESNALWQNIIDKMAKSQSTGKSQPSPQIQPAGETKARPVLIHFDSKP